MSAQRYTPEFKEEAVKQVSERGYSVAEVAARLGVSTHSLYKWVKAASPSQSVQHSQELLEAKGEILRLRRRDSGPPHGRAADAQDGPTRCDARKSRANHRQ